MLMQSDVSRGTTKVFKLNTKIIKNSSYIEIKCVSKKHKQRLN